MIFLISHHSDLNNHMDEIVLSIKDIRGHNIYTRGDGRILCQHIRKALKQSSKVIIDFNQREIASESFLDEAIVELYLPPEPPDFADRLILRNVAKPDQALLGRILEYRKRLLKSETKKSTKVRHNKK